MPVKDEFAEYLRDLLKPLGRIRLRRMFGGWGVYADDVFFALVVADQLYFKVDAITRPQFEASNLEEWIYEKNGKPVCMNYFRPPADIFEDEEALLTWGRLALAAALRSRKPAPGQSRKTVKPRRPVRPNVTSNSND